MPPARSLSAAVVVAALVAGSLGVGIPRVTTGLYCTNSTMCVGGGRCAIGACNVTAETCTYTAIPGCCASEIDCRDNDVCTRDLCDMRTGTCVHTELPDCCTSDARCRELWPTAVHPWCSGATWTCVVARPKPCASEEDCNVEAKCIDGVCVPAGSEVAPSVA